MVKLRQRKVDVIADSFDEIKPYGDDSGDLLVLGWGGTYGAIRSAVQRARLEGDSVSHIHLRNLNPMPKDLGEKLLKYKKVLIPEINLGQLNSIIRSKFLINTESLNKVEGKPFTPSEIHENIKKIL
jgi:2-oxoglutarate ferredoxin oxidoreductase subunit alpha